MVVWFKLFFVVSQSNLDLKLKLNDIHWSIAKRKSEWWLADDFLKAFTFTFNVELDICSKKITQNQDWILLSNLKIMAGSSNARSWRIFKDFQRFCTKIFARLKDLLRILERLLSLRTLRYWKILKYSVKEFPPGRRIVYQNMSWIYVEIIYQTQAN